MDRQRIRDFSENVPQCYLAVFLISATLYVLTCAPGALWQDSGMIQYRVYHNDIQGQLGLALSHPLYYIIAIGFKYLPFGQLGFKVNLVSALFGAFAVSNLFLLLRLWTGRFWPALTGALSLAVSHTFWRHCCIAESYNMFIALFLAGEIMLFQYFRTKKTVWLYALAAISGLSISVHMLGSIPLVLYLVLLIYLLTKKQVSIKDILAMACVWMVCAGPYLYLIIKTAGQTGDWAGTISSAAFGHGYKGDVLNIGMTKKIMLENIILIGMNFPTVNVLLFAVGLFSMRKVSICSAQFKITISLLFLFLVFAFRYTIVDRYAFFIPFYVMVSLLIGLGAGVVLSMKVSKSIIASMLIFALMPIGAYWAAPSLAAKAYPSLGMRRQIPYRDPYRFFLRPWKTNETGPERFATEALGLCEPDSIILADGTTVYALWYVQQIKGTRSDVRVVSNHGSYENPIEYPDENDFDQLISDCPVYVVSAVKGYVPGWLLENYMCIQDGVLYRVEKTEN